MTSGGDRPYRVPLPLWALVLMLAPAMGLLLTIIALPFLTLRWKVAPMLKLGDGSERRIGPQSH